MDGTLKQWNIFNAKLIKTFITPKAVQERRKYAIKCLDVASEHGFIISGGADRTLRYI